MSFVAAISDIVIDVLYSGLPRMPALGEEVYARDFDLQLGGGPPAALITLQKLGLPVKLGTYLSDDNLSTMGKILLKQYGIKYENLYKGEGKPVNITSIASFPEDRYFLSYYPGSNKGYCSDDEAYSFFKGAKVCFGLNGHNDIMKKLKNEGTIIVYDVGWSDDLNIDNLKDTLKCVNVFTPNDKEALKMTGTLNVLDALEIISRYVDYAIITLGKNGCVAKQGNEVIYSPPLKGLKVVDTTGAGDNFLAGIMYGLYYDWPIDRCLMMGNVTGGYSTTFLGCCSADITLDKVRELMNLTSTEVITNKYELQAKYCI